MSEKRTMTESEIQELHGNITVLLELAGDGSRRILEIQAQLRDILDRLPPKIVIPEPIVTPEQIGGTCFCGLPLVDGKCPEVPPHGLPF